MFITTFERDNETNLDYALARYYAKHLGRFNSADEPLVDQDENDSQSWNLYVYVRNNPLIFVDPTGKWRWSDPDKNGYRFVMWEEGDNWETLQKFLYEETGDLYNLRSLSEFYGAEGTQPLGEGLILDLGHFDGTPRPGPHGLEDASLDFIPAGRAGRVAEKTGFLQWVLRKFGIGASKQPTKKVAIRKALPVIQDVCFVKGTLIRTDSGFKAIEEIKQGDVVLSYNEKTRQTEFKLVVQNFVKYAEAGSVLLLEVEGERNPLGVTDEHPFFVKKRNIENSNNVHFYGEWLAADEIEEGNEILRADGAWARVESITRTVVGAEVYNFEVEENHNYFVGKTGLLAHNDCKKYIQKAIRAAKPQKNGNGLEHVMEDGTKLVFRRDVGAAAHPIGSKYPNAVDHYNVEVHVPYRGGYQKTANAHIILDKTGNVVDVFNK